MKVNIVRLLARSWASPQVDQKGRRLLFTGRITVNGVLVDTSEDFEISVGDEIQIGQKIIVTQEMLDAYGD